MKKLIVLIILVFGVAFAVDVFAKGNPVDEFVQDHKSVEGAFHIDLGTSFLKDDDVKTNLLEKIDQVRVFSVNKEDGKISKKEIKSFEKSLSKKGFEAYAKFRDSDTHIELLALQKKGRISDWVMLVDGEESFFILEIRGDFDFDDLEEISPKIDLEQSKYIKAG